MITSRKYYMLHYNRHVLLFNQQVNQELAKQYFKKLTYIYCVIEGKQKYCAEQNNTK